MRIRRYRPEDLSAVYDICVRTAAAGTDARGMYSSDDLMPERMLWPQLADYPAHLHIDLLGGFQRSGHGRALIETFLHAAAAHCASGVHVCVSAENLRALAFYERLGFVELPVPDPGPVVYLGRPTD